MLKGQNANNETGWSHCIASFSLTQNTTLHYALLYPLSDRHVLVHYDHSVNFHLTCYYNDYCLTRQCTFAPAKSNFYSGPCARLILPWRIRILAVTISTNFHNICSFSHCNEIYFIAHSKECQEWSTLPTAIFTYVIQHAIHSLLCTNNIVWRIGNTMRKFHNI